MGGRSPRDLLVRRLRLAYAGEYAAARAYAGHWRSLRRRTERDRVKQIMEEEWVHRRRVGQMLLALGDLPGKGRDLWMGLVGSAIAASCFVGGRYIPMYGAGRIERKNIKEYEEAARHAHEAGLHAWVDEFLHMAEVEWDHEDFFHAAVRGHWMHRLSGSWRDPPPRSFIRESFAVDCAQPGLRLPAGDGPRLGQPTSGTEPGLRPLETGRDTSAGRAAVVPSPRRQQVREAPPRPPA